MVFFEEVGGSLSAGGGGGGSKPEDGGGGERGPAWEESERKTVQKGVPLQPWHMILSHDSQQSKSESSLSCDLC